MEFKDKPLTISVISLITMIFFIIATSWNVYSKYGALEKRITMSEKEISLKASLFETDKINIKLTNIETMVQEMRADIKTLK